MAAVWLLNPVEVIVEGKTRVNIESPPKLMPPQLYKGSSANKEESVRHSDARDFKSGRTSNKRTRHPFQCRLARRCHRTHRCCCGRHCFYSLGLEGTPCCWGRYPYRCIFYPTMRHMDHRHQYTTEKRTGKKSVSHVLPPQQWQHLQEYQHQQKYCMNSSSLVPMHWHVPFHLALD